VNRDIARNAEARQAFWRGFWNVHRFFRIVSSGYAARIRPAIRWRLSF
jgi:hypothetical protein